MISNFVTWSLRFQTNSSPATFISQVTVATPPQIVLGALSVIWAAVRETTSPLVKGSWNEERCPHPQLSCRTAKKLLNHPRDALFSKLEEFKNCSINTSKPKWGWASWYSFKKKAWSLAVLNPQQKHSSTQSSMRWLPFKTSRRSSSI